MHFVWKSFLYQLIIAFGIPAVAQVDQQQVADFARDYGYRYKVPLAQVEAILAKAQYQPLIIERIEKPAEAMPWYRYRKIFMTEERINAGVEFWEANDQVLKQVSSESGVPEEIIVGILGVETYYGARMGSYSVLDALYTLGFGYPRRGAFFRSELEKFLQLVEQEQLVVSEIKGSYAGAIGYCQFMPSSYLAYAKNFDAKGGIDLVNNVDDAIASVANYIDVHRWKEGGKVAIKAKAVSGSLPLEKQSLKPKHSYDYYKGLKFETADGSLLNGEVTLLEFELEDGKEYWFGLNNFYVITRYNHSPMYALVVYQLAEAVKERKMAEKE